MLQIVTMVKKSDLFFTHSRAPTTTMSPTSPAMPLTPCETASHEMIPAENTTIVEPTNRTNLE